MDSGCPEDQGWVLSLLPGFPVLLVLSPILLSHFSLQQTRFPPQNTHAR